MQILRCTVSFAMVLLACGSSYPALKGTETLVQLRAMYGGGAVDDDCWEKRDANACQVLSAIWKAEYEEAAKRCSEGTIKIRAASSTLQGHSGEPCLQAALYALGCRTVRGYPEGSPDDDEQFREDNTGIGSCWSPSPYPRGLIAPPPLEVDKALGFIATACRHDDWKSCEKLVRILLDGLLDGVEIPRDPNLARRIYDAERATDPNYRDATPADRDREWADFTGARLSESDSTRAARIARVKDVYGKADAANGKLYADVSETMSHNYMLEALAAGFSAGGQTVFSTNESVASTRTTGANAPRASVSLPRPGPARGSTIPAATGAPADARSAAEPVCTVARPTQAGQLPGCACFANEQFAKGEELPGTIYTTVASCAGTFPCCCSQSGGVLCQCSPVVAGASCKQACDNTSGKVMAGTCSPSTPATVSP